VIGSKTDQLIYGCNTSSDALREFVADMKEKRDSLMDVDHLEDSISKPFFNNLKASKEKHVGYSFSYTKRTEGLTKLFFYGSFLDIGL
jgi:hypothetical protein